MVCDSAGASPSRVVSNKAKALKKAKEITCISVFANDLSVAFHGQFLECLEIDVVGDEPH